MAKSSKKRFRLTHNQFYAVTHKQWLSEGMSDESFNRIRIPRRSTSKSAGYDFVIPYNMEIAPHMSQVIKTGIKCNMDDDTVLMIFPRSSMGIKHGIYLMNTVGIIDADYYNNESNEGHIYIGLKNTSDEPLQLSAGDRIAQGIFIKYGTILTESLGYVPVGNRKGGFGSTGK